MVWCRLPLKFNWRSVRQQKRTIRGKMEEKKQPIHDGIHDKPPNMFGVRHIQFILLFFVAMIAYGMRTNMSQGVVEMINGNDNSDAPHYPEWEDQKNMMLSSFFIGYVCLQIGAGQLAEKYGPKLFLSISLVITSLFSILLPPFGAWFGYQGVIVCRVIQGLSQGFMYPSMHHLLGRWIPLRERAKVATFTYAGGPLGTAISNLVTGKICSTKIGWPGAFYLYGGLGLIWVALWLIIGSDTPSKNRWIGEAEKNYIEMNTVSEEHHTNVKTPWKKIATSLPMWAILITHAGQNWGFWTLMTEIPSYLDKIQKFETEEVGQMSAYPYFALWILSLIIGPAGDYLIVSGLTSVGTSRKIFNSLGLFVPATSLIILGFYTGDSHTLPVILLVISVGANAAVFAGFNVNHMDLSPTHSGTLMGITNSLSNLVSIFAPRVVDAIKTQGYKETDQELWKYVFCIAAGIFIGTGIFYNIFGTGERQPWDEVEEEKEKDCEKGKES